MVSIALTLLVLALIEPATSQGGAANLSVSPVTLQLDWFYLPIFPLLYLLSLGQVWALLGAGTALITALPWLPPSFKRNKAGEFRLTVVDIPQPVIVRFGETLLEAGLRQGLALPYECRNGGCGICRCTVLHGNVDPGVYQRAALPDTLRAQGMVLTCCATALSDLEIEVEDIPGAARTTINTHVGRIDTIEHLTEDLIRLTVALPAGERLDFTAGQYINILLADGQRRAFSFANAPHDDACIELHIRRVPGGRFTGHVFTAMKVGDPLRFEGPLGDFTLRESERPILFVAGATGFAPVKSIVEDAFHRGLRRPMWLYWGVRHRQDLYMAELAEQWQRQHDNFHFVAVLSHAEVADAWTGRNGLVHEAMLADFPDMSGYEVYVCGSVKMVQTAVPAFLEHGLGEDACFFDAFTPTAATGGRNDTAA
ncbi:MAG: CDP-6-deoxy-delta-3,4-glucoseen reductase [Betaproteobacteria bacterium]